MRPFGVTLIAYYQILRGALGTAFGLAVLLVSSLAARLASLAAEGNAAGAILHGLGRFAGLGVLILAVLHIVAGFGLLKMQNWGRLLTVLFSAIGLVVLLPVIMVAHGLPLVTGAINAISIIYLVMPSTKRLFHGAKPVLRAAA